MSGLVWGKRISAVSMAWLAAAISISSAHAADNWVFYTPVPTQTTAVKTYQTIADRIEKETNGELKIRINLGGSLQIQGGDVGQAVSDNVIQAADDLYFSGPATVAGILRLPGLLRNDEEALKASSILSPYVAAAYDQTGIKLASTLLLPPLTLFSKTKISSLDDLKGLKIRTFGPETAEIVKRFDGLPVSLSFAEMGPALERGVVDGFISNSSTVGYAMKDLIRHSYRISIAASQVYGIISKSALGRLSQKNQEIVLRAFKEGTESVQADALKDEVIYNEKLVQSGVTLTNATLEDQDRLAKRMSSYWEQWAKAQGPAASASLDALKKIREALGR